MDTLRRTHLLKEYKNLGCILESIILNPLEGGLYHGSQIPKRGGVSKYFIRVLSTSSCDSFRQGTHYKVDEKNLEKFLVSYALLRKYTPKKLKTKKVRLFK